ncbi:DMT family transporter [Alcaligenes sp. SJTW-7]|uniref:DMT family transporter n=1 Tax=Alcaligenes sp. SJTW-7 TaxID=3078429 RepID=UPI0039EBD38D
MTRFSLWLVTALTALGPAIWGSTYIVTTEILPADRPFIAAFLRCFPAGVILLLWSRRMPAQGEWGRTLILAALNIGAFQALLFVAAYRLPGGLAAVVGAAQPLVVIALAWALEGKRPISLALVACVLGIVGMGILLLSPHSQWDAWGMLAAIVGALCMALGTYLSHRWRSSMPILAFTAWQLMLGGLMLAPLALWLDPPLDGSLSMMQISGYLYLCLVGALLAYTLWFRGIAVLPSVAVSSLGLLSPLTAVILGWLILGQAMTGTSLLGMVLVMGSVLAVQWISNRPPAPRSEGRKKSAP